MSQPSPRPEIFRAFAASRSASVAMLFSLTLPVAMGAGAFATDIGMFYLERRALQAATDSAALAAANWPDRAPQLVREMLDASGNHDASFQLTFGNYSPETVDRDNRFVAHPKGNAVRVDATRRSPVYFARLFNVHDVALSARSDASITPVTVLSAGSRMAAADPIMLNAVLTPLTGVNLSLSALDYKGLVHSHIGLGTLLKALAVDGLGREVTGTLAKDVLSRPIKLQRVLQILSRSLDAAGDLVGGSVLRKAAQQVANSSVEVVLGDILNLDDSLQSLALNYPSKALDADIGVLGLLNAAIGSNNIGNTVKTGLNIPGLPSANIEMMVGEASQSANASSIGDDLPMIQTDQVRMRLQVQTPGALDLLGVRLNVPIELVVAGGTARVKSTKCSSDPALREVEVLAMPGVAKLALGKWTGPLKDANTHDRLSPAKLASVNLLGIGLVSIDGDSYASIQQTTPVSLVFRGAEIGNGTIKTAKTSTIATSLMKTLLTETNIAVNGMPTGLLLAPLSGLLTALTVPLDGLVNSALATAGVSLGELDIRVDDLVCDSPRIIG